MHCKKALYSTKAGFPHLYWNKEPFYAGICSRRELLYRPFARFSSLVTNASVSRDALRLLGQLGCVYRVASLFVHIKQNMEVLRLLAEVLRVGGRALSFGALVLIRRG